MRAETADQAASSGTTRRRALATMAASLTAAATTRAWVAAPADPPAEAALPPGAASLCALTLSLARATRRRNFKSVPMILTRPDEWGSEALKALLAYKGGPKQTFDNTEIDSPWLSCPHWATAAPDRVRVPLGSRSRAHS